MLFLEIVAFTKYKDSLISKRRILLFSGWMVSLLFFIWIIRFI